MLKLKQLFNPLMVNQSAKVKMTELDKDGTMKIEFVEEKLETVARING